MRWVDPDNPWYRKMKRRVGLYSAIGVFFLVAPLALLITMVIGAVSRVQGTASEDLSWLLWLPAIAWLVPSSIFLVGMLRLVRRERRVIRLVHEADACVCPRCVLEMNPSEECEQNGALLYVCSKCQSVWNEEDLHRYWEQYGLVWMQSARWRYEQIQSHLGKPPNRFQRSQRWAANHPYLWSMIVSLFVITIVGLVGLVFQWHWTVFLRRFVFFVPLMFGVSLIGTGAKQRRGHDTHCAKCDYAKAGASDSSDSRCPECGANWNGPGGTVYGHVTTNRPAFVAGLVLVVLAYGIMFGRDFPLFNRQIAKALPTRTLIGQIGSDPHAGDELWIEFANRSLTDSEYRELVERLLEQRRTYSFFSVTDGGNWLDGELQSNFLPEDLRNQYYEESVEFQIVGPSRVRLGETITLEVSGEECTSYSDGLDVMIAVAGFEIDGANRSTDGRDPQWRNAIYVDAWAEEDHLDTEFPKPSIGLTCDKIGTFKTRFVAWVVIIPDQVSLRRVKPWADDGSIAIPPQAIWSKKIELVHTIEVVE